MFTCTMRSPISLSTRPRMNAASAELTGNVGKLVRQRCVPSDKGIARHLSIGRPRGFEQLVREAARHEQARHFVRPDQRKRLGGGEPLGSARRLVAHRT